MKHRTADPLNKAMEEIKVKKEIEREDLEVQRGESEDTEKTLPWQKQITLRGIIASFVIGSVYSIISMKLNLTTGLAPNLNVSAGLLAYVVIQTWTKMLQRGGFSPLPFTKQENTMIQTCIVACYSIAYAGGFASYLLGLNKKTYELAGVETEGNSGYKEPGIGWMTTYSFLVCFVGLFVLIPLRKWLLSNILIIDYKLIYPSGTATAVLINGFHSRGDKMARKQVRGFLKFFSMSFFWGFFRWFFQGKNDCGFSQFPTFGLQAWKHTFFFDFSMTYVGAGMICTHLVNLSLLLGAVLSFGIMWPLISKLEGHWFPANMPEGSMRGLTGYKASPIKSLSKRERGDGLYNFVKVLFIVISNFLGKIKSKNPATDQDKAAENLKENRLFLEETISMKMAITGYLAFSIISTIAVPLMFPELKWYYVVVAYIIAPALSFCNAYGTGLTDINMAYNYGKVALFIVAAMSGKGTGVVAGLVGCGLMKSVISISCILMHDFKAGHLTLSSPRSMLLSQAIGTALGAVIAPLSFFMFYKAFDVGNPKGR
ncbi:Oligopeptide transporter, OPT superfamily [Dillenia turbinata]|uniref:Oligopeptide transporter, OPT superfamily n=1 Tax=Dillenia turbinata TaxID=194707 RepID=A0AAN8W8J7_9MAGN